ncbi:uncharacterized protein cyr [Drosophila pseudoobscura]|uniref:Uncharacterized protein cyr n=1 Tax=Drosophila pseudoobscura pseudoobscura TaxID=46245 RepID=A0A6I8VHT2_DROPS|nr:uncharacterized protein LOC4815171 [Drosophila pseudoobscura]XP_015041656.2 uncharacterized protein LOC4815171 [Drosophila pseudoobscura]XP_033238798.1 uncharacterized protein LOC4815171 [Drosophila pseudoobscura]
MFFFSFFFGFGLHRGLLPLAAVIGLLHLPQFVCHASWATRTTLTAATTTVTATSTDTSPSPSPTQTPTPTPTLAPSAVPSMQIQRLQVNCSREMLDMQLLLSRPFRGLLYAKDFPLECRSSGKDSTHLQLRIPTSGCGVRADPLADGGIEYTVRVMLQMEQKLRQSTDILSSVKCQLPPKAMGMPLPGVPGLRKDSGRERNARMRALAAASAIHLASSTVPSTVPHHHHHHNQHMDTPRVRIWLELGGPNGTGSVEVGVPTTLTVRAIVPGTIGVRVVDCAALDGLGESTQQLLDARGCPIDEQVMPALHIHHKPAEEGWSKQHEEDLVERTFAATFPAFKFPDRERLHVSCGVQLCKGKCPNLNCRLAEQQQQQLQLSADQHLARIEVFNSLAVTAPQIEVDRLRYDRRYNMSVEDYPPHVRPLPGEGTLCLSISKLAISFCILGLIFLVAVIVAIFSLIRTRRRERRHGARLGFGLGLGLGSGTGTGTGIAGTSTSNSSSRLHRDRAEICTSMFSSSSESAQSQPRFGGKFLMPYYPNALPYGRVY